MDRDDTRDPLRRAETRLGQAARRQGGAFSRDDALGAGIPATEIATRLRTGLWTTQFGAGIRAATTPVTTRLREEAALMRVGRPAALSHFSAAAHWRLDVPVHRDVWLTVPVSRAPRPRAGIRVVRSRAPYEPALDRLDGLPVCSVARTIADLAAFLDVRGLTALALAAMQRELCLREDIEFWHRALHGRPGSADLRRVLEEVDPAFESVLSAEFARLTAGGGIALTPRHVVVLPNGSRAICDFADVARRIAFEADGAAYHAAPGQVARDRARDRALLRLGWVVARYTTEEIRRRPQQTLADVHAQLAARDRSR